MPGAHWKKNAEKTGSQGWVEHTPWAPTAPTQQEEGRVTKRKKNIKISKKTMKMAAIHDALEMQPAIERAKSKPSARANALDKSKWLQAQREYLNTGETFVEESDDED